MIATCTKALAVASVLLALGYHTPGAVEHAMTAAERGTPRDTSAAAPKPKPYGEILAAQYARPVFRDLEREYFPPEE